MGTLLFIWLETGNSWCSRLGTNAPLALKIPILSFSNISPILFFVVGRIRTSGCFRAVLFRIGLRGIHGINDVISKYLCEDIQQCCCIFVPLCWVELFSLFLEHTTHNTSCIPNLSKMHANLWVQYNLSPVTTAVTLLNNPKSVTHPAVRYSSAFLLNSSDPFKRMWQIKQHGWNLKYTEKGTWS